MARQTLTVQLMHATSRIAALEEQLHAATAYGQQLAAEKRALEVKIFDAAQRPAAAQPSTKPLPTEFGGYWDYVRAAKKWCYANNRPVAYAAPEQFDDAHAALEAEVMATAP